MTSGQVREAQAFIAAGMTPQAAAKAAGVKWCTLRNYLHEQKQRKRWEELARIDAPKCAPLTLQEVRRAEAMYAAGSWAAQVARALGRHAWVVRKWREAWRKERRAVARP